MIKHGLSYTPEYRAWQQMRLRCTNPQHKAWPDYGGRGILVCDRWLHSVENFIADMGLKPTAKHEIDRENNDGHYEPGNCRWVVRKVNCRNRRNNHLIAHEGLTLSMSEWSERSGVPCDTISHRLRAGWSTERALSTPARPKAPRGQAKHLVRNLCVDCGAQETSGLRCRSCENRNRARANFAHEAQIYGRAAA